MKTLRLICIVLLLGIVGIQCVMATNSAANKEATLENQFLEAEYSEKLAIIDKALASKIIPTKLLSDLINTDRFINSFSTPDVFRVFQLRTALKMGEIATPEICEILRVFYYEGKRSRRLDRPKTYSFDFDWQKRIAEIEDTKGTHWALTKIWWLGCYDDLWLIKRDRGDEHWSGPWFTGFNVIKSAEEPNYILCFEHNELHLIIPYQENKKVVDHIISPKALMLDSDGDGLYDVEEERLGTNPQHGDTDRDGLFDGEDLNPIAPGTKKLRPRDYARQAVFRLEAIGNYPINLYIVQAEKGDKLEYFSPSPNAFILSLEETRQFFQEFLGQEGGLQVAFRIIDETEKVVTIEIDMKSQGIRYRVEKCHGVWIVTKQLGCWVY